MKSADRLNVVGVSDIFWGEGIDGLVICVVC